MRHIVLVVFVVLGFFGAVASVGAQQGGEPGCPQFSSDQVAAQAYFDANGGSATNNLNGMDANGNGVACDEPGAFEGGGPSAGPDEGSGPSAGPGCEGFNYDQAAAQEYFEANRENSSYARALDSDGNGIACDEAGAFGSGPSAGPEPTVADATDDTTTTDTAAASADSGDVQVASLPSTGSGTTHMRSDAVVAFAGVSALVLAGVALIGRRAVRM